MNTTHTRREFLADVGRGMLVASVGYGMATELGLAPAFAADAPDALDFGALEPLVCLMQETPANKLLPGARGQTQVRHRTEPPRRRRRAGQRPHFRRRRLRRLPHDDGAGAGVAHGARTSRSRFSRCPSSRSFTATPIASRNTAGARRKCCTPSNPATLARRPRRRRSSCAKPSAARTCDEAERTFAALAQRLRRRRAQPTPLHRAGRHRSPSRRPAVSRVGFARPHRQGAGAHAAPPIRPLLREGRVMATHRHSGTSRARSCRSCSNNTNSSTARPARARRKTSGWTNSARPFSNPRPNKPPKPPPPRWPKGLRPPPLARRFRSRPINWSCATMGRPPQR